MPLSRPSFSFSFRLRPISQIPFHVLSLFLSLNLPIFSRNVSIYTGSATSVASEFWPGLLPPDPLNSVNFLSLPRISAAQYHMDDPTTQLATRRSSSCPQSIDLVISLIVCWLRNVPDLASSAHLQTLEITCCSTIWHVTLDERERLTGDNSWFG